MIRSSPAGALDPSAAIVPLIDAGEGSGRAGRRLPGYSGVWFFICADVTFFALLFGSFCFQRSLSVSSYGDSQLLLHPAVATLNTAHLLTSSWLVALAVAAVRQGRMRISSTCIGLAIGLGGLFVATKLLEYVLLANTIPAASEFFMYYFAITGIHLLHVVAGLVALSVCWFRSGREKSGPGNLLVLESAASFWHTVDLLWLVIFPLLYLLR